MGGVEYDNEIFRGLFKLKEQFELIIKNMASDDSEIIICHTDSACQSLGIEQLDIGIYTLNKFHEPIKLTSYSQGMWENIKDGIIKTFINLNAGRIFISDKTVVSADTTLGISKEITALAPKLGLNLNKKDMFSFDMKLNGVFNIDKASKSLYKISDIPELKTLAEHIIENENAGRSYESTAFLDVTFGANLNLITIFQGSFSAGYSRQLEIKIDFLNK